MRKPVLLAGFSEACEAEEEPGCRQKVLPSYLKNPVTLSQFRTTH